MIDTTDLSAKELSERVMKMFRLEHDFMLRILSFGFKHAPPRDADLVIDVRSLPNPYYDPALRPLSGRQPDVAAYVFRDPEAEAFYAVHKERPFFKDLVGFMISGPVVIQVLEGENAIAKNREVMGATNPANVDAGTIRKEFALSVGENSVHGSDAAETAKEEISFFFSGLELVG